MKKLVHKIIRYCRKKGIRICRHYSGHRIFGDECIAFNVGNVVWRDTNSDVPGMRAGLLHEYRSGRQHG